MTITNEDVSSGDARYDPLRDKACLQVFTGCQAPFNVFGNHDAVVLLESLKAMMMAAIRNTLHARCSARASRSVPPEW